MNYTEHSEVGVFEMLDTNVRQVIDVGSEKNPSVPTILSDAFLKSNEGYFLTKPM